MNQISIKYIIVVLIIMAPCLLQAQTKPVQVIIHDSHKKSIIGASIAYQIKPIVKDSIQAKKVQRSLTDTMGKTFIYIDSTKTYFISMSAIGYQQYDTSIKFSKAGSIKFVLKEQSTMLNEVVVKSSKALIRQEDDKSIVDAELLAASSTNAYETVEKTPGIFIDQDGQIYLNGLSPAGIQINGRDLKMSASDIAILLKSLPPNAVQKIELIRTPSAKYDASGGGGVINIILMKGIKLGMNGSVNMGLTQGVYGNKYVGFNLSNNNDKLTSYINAQYNDNDSYSITNTDRSLAVDSILQQKANTVSPNKSFYVGYGLSKNVSDHWELNYDGRISQQSFSNTTNNQSILRKISTNSAFNSINSLVTNTGTNNNFNQSIRSKLKLDTANGEWVTDFSFNYAKSNSDQAYQNNVTGVNLNSSGLGNFGNDKSFYVFQSDLKKKWIGLTVETGLKSAYLAFNNNAAYTKTVAGVTATDLLRTSGYKYKEQINATYLQASKTWGAVILKVGTRLEQTIMEGHQIIPSDTTFSVNRTDAFPYVYLSRRVAKIAGYEVRGFLVYRKTIARPSYENLNPFIKFVDPFLSEVGNPALRPQFTSNYEANISVDDKPLFAFGVNETKDIFSAVIYQSPTNKQMAYRTYANLAKSKETYFRIVGVVPPGKKFFAVIGTQYNRNVYTGLYEGKPIVFDKGTWSFFTFQSFKIDKLSTITLNGFWRTNGQQQFYELDNFGSINTTINRQFLKKKLIITASVNDIFFTSNNRFVLRQGSVNATGYRESDSRRWGISMRYNFGFKPKENKFEMLDQMSKDN